MGKPITQSRKEVITMIERAESLIKIAPEILADDNIHIDSSSILKIAKEPIGISVIMSPWSYPVLSGIGSIIPSIICGNSVLLKHSPRTPLIGSFFKEAFNSVGALNIVQDFFIENEAIPKALKHFNINYVSLTGSLEKGRAVLLDIAKTGRFIHTHFDLGGKDAAYVCDDADMDFAIQNVIDGAMFNCGQSSSSIDRVYVHDSIYEEFIEKATEFIESFYHLGNPLDEATNLGPMALPDATLILKDEVEDAVQNGAEIEIGGHFCNDGKGKGRFFEPTLIKDCRSDMQIMRKRTFGPIVAIEKVQDDDEAVNQINNSEYGLSASIYTTNYKRVLEIGKRVFISSQLFSIIFYYFLFKKF